VRGIGEKTASKLIAEHGSLDTLLAAAALAPAVASKLDAAREYLAAARRVVPPVRDVALSACDLSLPTVPADADALAALAEEWKLTAAVERLQRAIAGARAAV
jgi:5'-3' exonuclease